MASKLSGKIGSAPKDEDLANTMPSLSLLCIREGPLANLKILWGLYDGLSEDQSDGAPTYFTWNKTSIPHNSDGPSMAVQKSHWKDLP